MPNIEEALELKRKAIQIVYDRGVYDSIDWMIEQYQLGHSDELEVDNRKTSEDFENCQKYFSFSYKSRHYQLFLENGHYFSTYDGNAYWGDMRLLYDGELVFKLKYEKESDEWGSKYRLVSLYTVVAVLRLDDWVNDLPAAVQLEKNALLKTEQIKKAKKGAEDARKIRENFDLGKFKD
jgi:hypothetical protein